MTQKRDDGRRRQTRHRRQSEVPGHALAPKTDVVRGEHAGHPPASLVIVKLRRPGSCHNCVGVCAEHLYDPCSALWGWNDALDACYIS